MRFMEQRRAAVRMGILVVCATVVGCGGPSSDRATDEVPAREGTARKGLDRAGPPAGLLRGSQSGVLVTFNRGGVSVQLNDLASTQMRQALQGHRVTVACGDARASTTWRADCSSATLSLPDAGDRPASCTVSVGGQTLVTVELKPLAR